MKQVLLLVSLLVAGSLGIASPSPQAGGDPSPVPNQECGLSTVGNPIPPGPVSGCGPTDADAYWNALAAASGVVCEICGDGIQCEREVIGTQSSGTVIGSYSQNEDGERCFSGTVLWAELTITCHDC